MHTNANYRRFKMPPHAASLHAHDLCSRPIEVGVDERDEDWEEFLSVALPRDPVDEEPGTHWRRAPVMLSY